MRFSVIIPNFNSKRWIEKCINSVLNQTFTDYELIIVDDMSTDGSDSIAFELIKNNNKHNMIWNKTKRLTGGTRNVGIAEAKGDYILCIDSDDWLINDKVLADINEKLNDEDIMYLGFKMVGSPYEEETILNFKNKDDEFHNPYAGPWLKVVKRELYLKCPFPEGTLYEDRLQNYDLVLHAKTFTNFGKVSHCWNRANENSVSKDTDGKWCTYRFEYCGELYKLIKTMKDDSYKKELIEELKMYLKSCNEMVEEL